MNHKGFWHLLALCFEVLILQRASAMLNFKLLLIASDINRFLFQIHAISLEALTEAEKRWAVVLSLTGEGQAAPGCILCFGLKLFKCFYMVRILIKNDDSKRTNPDDLKQHLRVLKKNFPPSAVVQALDPKAHTDTNISRTRKVASALQNKTLQCQVATYKEIVQIWHKHGQNSL